jgi:hypothetical protein
MTVRTSGIAAVFPAGSGSYMEAEIGYTGIELTNHRTVSLWVKIPTVSGVPPESTNAAMVYWGHDFPGGNTHGRVWSCELKNGKPRLWIRGAHATVDRQLEGDRAVVDDGKWHLLVFQFAQGTTIDDVELYIDDTGPLDMAIFGAGTTINTTSAAEGQPFTLGARNVDTLYYTVERDMILEQVAVWTDPLTSRDVAFLWNKGYNGTELLTSGTNGDPDRGFGPNALSGTINLDAWYSFDSPRDFTDTVFNVATPGSRRLAVFNGAFPIRDTPASGILYR